MRHLEYMSCFSCPAADTLCPATPLPDRRRPRRTSTPNSGSPCAFDAHALSPPRTPTAALSSPSARARASQTGHSMQAGMSAHLSAALGCRLVRDLCGPQTQFAAALRLDSGDDRLVLSPAARRPALSLKGGAQRARAAGGTLRTLRSRRRRRPACPPARRTHRESCPRSPPRTPCCGRGRERAAGTGRGAVRLTFRRR